MNQKLSLGENHANFRGARQSNCIPIPPSVYSAKVRIVLRAKGVAFEDVPPPGGYGSDAYQALVPYGTMPAIEDGRFSTG